jgi:hypothetical protein
VHADQKVTKYMVVGSLMLGNVCAEHSDMVVECFQGIENQQLHRVIENSALNVPETLLIHAGTNDMRTTVNLNFLLGKTYDLVATAKRKFRTADLS